MARCVPVFLLLGTMGCASGRQETALVPSNPFAGSTPRLALSQTSAATEEVSLRVGKVGQKVLAANPQLAIKPLFATVGASTGGPAPDEIFHTGENQIAITESLVRKCKTDGQLAALLAVELAKMTSEREVRAGLAGRSEEAGPPADVPVGGDVRSAFGPADGTRAVELAKYDRSHNRGLQVAPDPKVLARNFVIKAGYKSSEIEAAAPLLAAAEKNATLEKQMNR